MDLLADVNLNCLAEKFSVCLISSSPITKFTDWRTRRKDLVNYEMKSKDWYISPI